MTEATRLTFELIWASPENRDKNNAVIITAAVLKRIGMEAGLDEATASHVVEELDSDENKATLKQTSEAPLGFYPFCAASYLC